MARGKKWTPEEDAYLSEMWGYVSIDGLGKHLNRSRNAVICRVRRLGLPPFLESGDYVTMNQLLHALGYGSVHAYHVKSWVEERGFPMKIKMRSSKAKVKVVYLEDFWAWAEKNRSFVDFSRMEPLALGKEPAWVQEQRRIDYRSFAIQRKDPLDRAGGQPPKDAPGPQEIRLRRALRNAVPFCRRDPTEDQRPGSDGQAGSGSQPRQGLRMDAGARSDPF
jgi:hypothetical protein